MLDVSQITVPGEITKNGETRYVPISDRLAPVLLERHSVFQHLSEYVFIYRDPKTGEYNPIGSIKNSFTSGCRRAGIEGQRFHDLRHTAGTRWINEGKPQITVQRIMGHKGAEMSNVYINLSAKDLRDSFLGR